MKRIGIDLGGTKIKGIVLAEDGRVLSTRRAVTPSQSYAGTVAAIVRMVAELDGDSGEARDLPVGIGTPGIWMAQRSAMKNCNSTWLNGQPLLLDLEHALGARVRIANDADCFALSEAMAGTGRGYGSVFGVILGTGVGGGFVTGGRLMSGPNGLAGEWGHTPLPYLGLHEALEISVGSELDRRHEQANALESRLAVRTCYCGRPGCVETYLSGPGWRQTHRELWSEDVPTETIAKRRDERSEQTFFLYTRMFARSLAQIVNIVDPAVIVLGGGLSNVQALYQPVNEMLARYVFSGECDTQVKAPQLGAESGVLGAAQLWSDNGG